MLTHPIPLETKDAGDGDDLEVKDALDRLERSVDDRVKTATDAALKPAQDEIKGLRAEIAALKRPGASDDKTEDKAETKAFVGFVRHGRETLSPDEVKVLTVSSDTGGGFVAPEQFSNELIRDIVEYSPIRQLARVTSMSSHTLLIPTRPGNITAQWVPEVGPRPETQPSFGQVKIEAHEMAAWVDVSNQLLEDATIDIEAELRIAFAEEFGRLEAEAFINGDGAGKPEGVLENEDIPELVAADDADLGPDDLLKLMYALPRPYRQRGAWMLTGDAILQVRLLKDTSGRYLWQEGLTADAPPTLFGRPVVEALEMPDVAAGAVGAVFGDFNTAYRIADRVATSILRNPYIRATDGVTRFHGRRRVGGAVVQPKALRKLVMAA